MNIGVIILTKNEEIHISRCMDSVSKISDKIFVVDSYSDDNTVSIVKSHGGLVKQRNWKNYSDQFQWAIDNFPFDVDWLMRIDADEYLSDELCLNVNNINEKELVNNNSIYVNRRIVFNGKWIRRGGIYPTELLRIWRIKCGKIEDRWMDEHIVVRNESSIKLKGDIIDENINNFTWWINKHNSYASREALDYLIHKFKLHEEEIVLKSLRKSGVKRILKETIFENSALLVRPIIYFIYRYFFRLGFIDGVEGFIWHFMQGLWYRMLVDVKIWKVKKAINRGATIESAILKELNISL